jgi:FkbM family methyltransferase
VLTVAATIAPVKTATKIACASALSAVVRGARRLCRRPAHGVFRRGGILWDLDLREGIDFAIYLFGRFEPATVSAYSRRVRQGAVVVDIGANIGAHSLHFARLVGPDGRVLAFEPTQYAFAKLRRNIELNPGLASRILPSQSMLVATDGVAVPAAIYSSWPLVASGDLHAVHRGELRSTSGASAVTLDAALEAAGHERVDVIKLDVDGNEPEVVAGGKRILERSRPVIFMELAPYLYPAGDPRFATMLATLTTLGYRFVDERTARPVPDTAAALAELVGEGASVNVIAEAR